MRRAAAARACTFEKRRASTCICSTDQAKRSSSRTPNWATQREPADARILLEAAIAAGEPPPAQPVSIG